MAADHSSETVIFVHGLWMNGLDCAYLRRQVSAAGYQVRQFHYASVRRDLAFNAHRLSRFVTALGKPRIHFVGHSLGGILIRHCLSQHTVQGMGKVVMLGTPNQGSIAADRLQRFAIGRLMLGRSCDQGLLGGAPAWHAEIPLGIIAGDYPVGLGRIFPSVTPPCDGTVRVAETLLEGMQDHVVLGVSHTSMLFSALVGRKIVHFLENGTFAADPGHS